MECDGDTITMKIDAGVVAKSSVTFDLYEELFDDVKARIEKAGRS